MPSAHTPGGTTPAPTAGEGNKGIIIIIIQAIFSVISMHYYYYIGRLRQSLVAVKTLLKTKIQRTI